MNTIRARRNTTVTSNSDEHRPTIDDKIAAIARAIARACAREFFAAGHDDDGAAPSCAEPGEDEIR